MKNKYVFVTVLLCAILAIGMGLTNVYVKYAKEKPEKDTFTIVTSFYPMYVRSECGRGHRGSEARESE